MALLPDPVEKPTLTPDETAKVLGLGRTATYEAIRRGEIPSLRFGRSVKVPTAALLRLLGHDPDSDVSPNPEIVRDLSIVRDAAN